MTNAQIQPSLSTEAVFVQFDYTDSKRIDLWLYSTKFSWLDGVRH